MGGNTFPSWRNDVVATDIIHSRIHKGLFYSAHLYDVALGNGTALNMLIQVSESVACHLRVTGSVGGDGTLELFETPTVSNEGVLIVPTNHNRFTDIRAAETVISSGPTTSPDGELLDRQLITGGPGPLSLGGSDSLFEEFILPLDGVYMARLTNIAGQDKPALLQLDFYEPVNRVGII